MAARSAGVKIRALQAGSVLLLLACWEGVVRAGLTSTVFVPAPTAMGRALAGILGTTLPELRDTLAKTLVAYVFSVVLGVGLGLVIG